MKHGLIGKLKVRSILLFLALGLTVGLQGGALAQDNGPIKVGMVMPLTGPAAFSGFSARIGASLAVKEINAAGGVLGRQVELMVADDAADPTQAVNETRRMIERENARFLFGPLLSHLTLAIAPITTAAKIPNISTAQSSAVTTKVMPYGFQMGVLVGAQVDAMVRYAAETLKVKSAAIYTDSGAQAKDSVESFRRGLDARGIRLTGIQEAPIGSTDVTPQLLSLRRGNPEVILSIITTGEDAGLVLKTLDDIGWKVKMLNPTFATTPATVLKVAGQNAFVPGNAAGVAYKPFTYCPNEAPGTSPISRLMANVKTYEPQSYDKAQPQVIAFFYDAVYLFKSAAEGTKSLDGARMASWIEDNAASISGRPSGRYSATKTNHFLFGPDNLDMITRPDIKREDGAILRANC